MASSCSTLWAGPWSVSGTMYVHTHKCSVWIPPGAGQRCSICPVAAPGSQPHQLQHLEIQAPEVTTPVQLLLQTISLTRKMSGTTLVSFGLDLRESLTALYPSHVSYSLAGPGSSSPVITNSLPHPHSFQLMDHRQEGPVIPGPTPVAVLWGSPAICTQIISHSGKESLNEV